jgi:hypothetical protein
MNVYGTDRIYVKQDLTWLQTDEIGWGIIFAGIINDVSQVERIIHGNNNN